MDASPLAVAQPRLVLELRQLLDLGLKLRCFSSSGPAAVAIVVVVRPLRLLRPLHHGIAVRVVASPLRDFRAVGPRNSGTLLSHLTDLAFHLSGQSWMVSG